MSPTGEIVLEQIAHQPSIYLDQWAWGLLSENEILCNEFISISSKVNASIMYSYLTFYEMAKVNDPQQIKAYIKVMDNLDYGLINTDFGQIIDSENRYECSPGTFLEANPIVDGELMKEFATICNPLKEFQISNFLNKLREEITTFGEDKYKKLTNTFDENLTPFLEEARQDNEAVARGKKRNASKVLQRNHPPYTRDILRIAIDFLLLNKTMKMNKNEWVDIFHTIVPVAYLDFVLLDNRWYSFIKDRCQLKSPKIAKVYSKQQMGEFFMDLSNFKLPIK